VVRSAVLVGDGVMEGRGGEIRRLYVVEPQPATFFVEMVCATGARISGYDPAGARGAGRVAHIGPVVPCRWMPPPERAGQRYMMTFEVPRATLLDAAVVHGGVAGRGFLVSG
jgi:hypothetical protein